MPPELARRIVGEFSSPGDLVLGPMCGIGTTLVEAAALGRRAVGVELEERWAALARENAVHVLGAENEGRVEVRRGDATALCEVTSDLEGAVDLVCTSPPYACDVGNLDKTAWGKGRDLCPTRERNYSTDRANLGHARGEAYEQAMTRIYAGCHRVLRPGGILVTVTKNTRRSGRTLDLAGLTVVLARRAGFAYLGHVVALHGAIRDGDLVGRASFWQLQAVRKARSRGEPLHLVAHEDVLAFAKPATSASSQVPTAHRQEATDAR